MINRAISSKIIGLYQQYPVVSLVGPRQSGKTTLIKQLFAGKPYVNLEDLENREFAEQDPKGFLAQYAAGAVIDEAQRVPELFSAIQVAVDQNKKNSQFVLSGSQNFLLTEGISQSLAGRVAVLTLLPLSLAELSMAGPGIFPDDLETALFKGFYPKLYDQKIEISPYYSNYILTYIERDVRLIKNISDLSAFKRFLNLCAARTGQLLNITSLAGDCGISQATAKAWLSTLEASFVIFLLKPHYKNFSKRVVKMPKLYFYDTGLLCSLLGISKVDQLKSHFLRGGIFESLIIVEWFKHCYNRASDPRAYFWRDKTGHEVDLLVEGEKLHPIEIKSGRTVSQEFLAGLEYYRKLAGQNSAQGYLVYGADSRQERSQGRVLGWRDWPKELLNIIDNAS